MSCVVLKEGLEVRVALDDLGLKESTLAEAIAHGEAQRANCTPHHPSYYVGIKAQAETVKHLSDLLVPQGWTRTNVKSSPRLVRGHLAIGVLTGDAATGIEGAVPRTKSPKGITVQMDVARNAAQMSIPGIDNVSLKPGSTSSDRGTWFLLFHVDEEEIRCELSRPIFVDEDDHPAGWSQRIILSPLTQTGRSDVRGPPVEEEEEETIDVPVTRKSE